MNLFLTVVLVMVLGLANGNAERKLRFRNILFVVVLDIDQRQYVQAIEKRAHINSGCDNAFVDHSYVH